MERSGLADERCALRSLVRQGKRLLEDRSRCVLQIQKALTEMNVRLDSVLSDLMGTSGQRILRAIVAGERNPQKLAELRHGGVRASADTVAASLEGTWRLEHLFALRQGLDRYDFFDRQIAECDAAIRAEITVLTPESSRSGEAEHSEPGGAAPEPAAGTKKRGKRATATRDPDLSDAVAAMMGVDLTAIPAIGPKTALLIASEIGPDLSAFPTMQHFCSWLGLAPGTRISGDRKLRNKKRMPVNPAGQALKLAALAARRSETYIGAKHRARLARMDTPAAIKATAHELARLIYIMVTRGEAFVEQGIDAFEEQRSKRKIKHLQRAARQLGLTIAEPVPAPA